jgi:hypothetical protein
MTNTSYPVSAEAAAAQEAELRRVPGPPSTTRRSVSGTDQRPLSSCCLPAFWRSSCASAKSKLRYLDSILQITDGDAQWSVYVRAGPIEKLSHATAGDDSLASTAQAFQEIARNKLKLGQTLKNCI